MELSLVELWSSDYAYPVQAFLAKGALVLEPNYRGSAGFGAKFRALPVRNLGVRTPTLIQNGSNDQRVPLAGAFELYRGLQDQHVDSRLILYEDSDTASTSPSRLWR
jgi:dipeptidyl aminopeptidase/acylaminoacyl peptidase